MYDLLNFISHIPKILGQTDIFSQCEGMNFDTIRPAMFASRVTGGHRGGR